MTGFNPLLVGQRPRGARFNKLGVLAGFDQRVGLRCAMSGLTAWETVGYLHHHLPLAGRGDPLFSDAAAG